MNCNDSRTLAIEVVRNCAELPEELAAHLSQCDSCAQLFDRQLALQPALCSMQTGTAPPDLEAKLLVEFDAAMARPVRQFRWWIPAMASACAAALVVGIVLTREPAQVAQNDNAPFVEIPYVGPLAPYERTEVRRVLVPVAALAAAGFEVHVADSGAELPADVLFGQDGRAHAIRLVLSSDSNRRVTQ